MKKVVSWTLLIPATILFVLAQRALFLVWFFTALVALPFILLLTRCKRDHPIDVKFAEFLDRFQSIFAYKSNSQIEFKEFPIEDYNLLFQ